MCIRKSVNIQLTELKKKHRSRQAAQLWPPSPLSSFSGIFWCLAEISPLNTDIKGNKWGILSCWKGAPTLSWQRCFPGCVLQCRRGNPKMQRGAAGPRPATCPAHTCGSTACPAHHPMSWQPTCLQKMPKQSRIKTKKLILRPGHAGAGKDYECCQRSSVQAERGDAHVCLHVYISHTASLSPLGTFPL